MNGELERLMDFHSKRTRARIIIFAALAYAYFVLFPDDFDAVLAPLKALLATTQYAPFGLYLVLTVAVAGGFVLRWSRAQR